MAKENEYKLYEEGSRYDMVTFDNIYAILDKKSKRIVISSTDLAYVHETFNEIYKF